LLALFGGLAIGIGMALRFIDMSWYGHARLVHLHLNLLGFVTLAIVGTMHNLLPTILQNPLYSPRLARTVFFLLPTGIAMLIVGFATSSLKTEIVAGILLVIGAGLYAFNLFATWWMSGQAGNAASDHLLLATFFLVLAVVMGVLVGVNSLWEPPIFPFGTLHLVAYTHMALVGFVLQTILGALSHLVPVTLAVSRVHSHKKRGLYLEQLTAMIDRWRIVHVGGLSLGTMGLAIVAALTWTLPLGSTTIQAAMWATFGLILIALTFFTAKLAWVLGTRHPE
jgi:cbb3-type cytochrome oxidase subunit 1